MYCWLLVKGTILKLHNFKLYKFYTFTPQVKISANYRYVDRFDTLACLITWNCRCVFTHNKNLNKFCLCIIFKKCFFKTQAF